MIASMFHFSVATHYCGGQLADSKVSVTGKLASCGMEGCEMTIPLQGTNFTNHCCDDFVTFCKIDCNYTPSSTVVPDSYQFNFQIFFIPAESPVYSSEILKSPNANESPPGVLLSTQVDLTDICVFRI
jgi:hypothetical protein